MEFFKAQNRGNADVFPISWACILNILAWNFKKTRRNFTLKTIYLSEKENIF